MWEKKVLTHCRHDYYDYYKNLEEAKEACTKDSNCAAIFDDSCDNFKFFLCPLGYTEKVSANSCLYIKSSGTVIKEIIKMNILQRY